MQHSDNGIMDCIPLESGHKKDLRASYRHLRSQLSAVSQKSFNKEIFTCFLENISFETIRSLHLFLPIIEQKEVNTYPIIEYIRQKHPHITLLCSQSNPQTLEMPAFILHEDTVLVKNRWGVPEPHHAQAYPHTAIDMVLLPLLVADEQGYRVGYGKGFYDRFLSTCKPDIIRIGLSFFSLIPEILDVEPTDERMDYCIVRNKWVRFSS